MLRCTNLAMRASQCGGARALIACAYADDDYTLVLACGALQAAGASARTCVHACARMWAVVIVWMSAPLAVAASLRQGLV